MQPIFTKGKPCLNDMNPSLGVRGIAFALTLIFTLATAVATHAQTPPSLPIVTITTDTPMVAEPQSMYFTLRADPATSSDLAIEVYIHQPNRPDVAPYFSHFTIQAGESESDHHLTTQDTNAINEDYEIIVKPQPSYSIGAADRVQFNVTDSRRYQIDVYAAHSAISEGETAEFIVTIAPPPEEDQIIAAVLNFANSTTTSYSETFAIPINQGETEARYTVPTEDDAEAGNSYYMILAVSPDQNQLADPVEWVYVNVFDDDQPTIAISDVPEVYEGEDMVFTIRLVPPATTPVSVDYATQDYTAKAGFDYFSSEGTVTFAPGESEKQIRVTTIDDNLAETLVENFSFSLSNATGARIAFPQISDCQACQGVIRDDDGQREISVTTTTPEVRSGEDMHFRFQVNAATGYDTSFPYFLMKYLDDEVVEVRQNYTSLPQGRRFVDVTLKANREGADNTTSRVRYVMHAEDSHVLMIVSANTTASVNVLPAPPPDTPIDKVLPLVTLSTNAITINNTSVVNEPDPIYVTINADPPPTDDLAVLVRTHEFDGVRYVSDRGAHFYTIPAGQQSTTFLISTSDIASDYDDRFVFSLLPSPNDDYRLGSQPPLEVLIDDQQNYAYFITMTPLEEYVTEGDNAHYVLHATPTPSEDLTIHYKYDFSYAKNPASIFGYNGYATILAGENTTSFTILAPDDNLTHATTNLEQIIELYLPLSDDYESESDYVYTMVLDDDGGAVISQTLLAETSEGDNLSIEVFLSQALNTTASVDYEVISKHKTAEAGVDYIPQNGTLTFAPGETKHMVSIQTIDNDIVDFKRIVQLKLSNPEGAILQHQDTQ
ncbi:MAG: hypothetical protein MJE68_16025, partial [Proteobacteria bacterium]|nr:hypothetical protein [Pseudomonadota bacterium]